MRVFGGVAAAAALLVARAAFAQDTTTVPKAPPAPPPRAIANVPDSLSGITTVSYVVGSSVYIAAGSKDGLAEKSRVLIVRDTAVVGEVKVNYTSWHSASAQIVSQRDSIVAGDEVRFSPVIVASVAEQPNTPIGSPVAPVHAFGVRGMVGMSFQAVAPIGSSSGSMTQPALQLQLAGAQVMGTPLSFNIDARARQTYTPPPPAGLPNPTSSYDGTRVYQAWANWADRNSGFQVTLGRQYSSALAPVSLFDGATAALDKDRWGTGIFAGTQPAPLTMGFSTQIKEYGAYVQVHQNNALPATAGVQPSRWAFTLGGINSEDGGQLNRQFAFLQAFYTDRRFLLWATQEVDYNSGWKVDSLHEPNGMQPTNTFINAQWTVTNGFYLHAGFDNRKNVPLYRDYVSPVTQLDDRFRQGVWGGFSWNPNPAWRAGFDARVSNGGASGQAQSFTAMAQNSSWIPNQGLIALRATMYTTDATVCGDATGTGCTPMSKSTNGWLLAANASINPTVPLRLGMNGGYRQDNGSFGAASLLVPQTGVWWAGLDADYMLGLSWYLLLSGTYTSGGAESSTQIYTSLSYRF